MTNRRIILYAVVAFLFCMGGCINQNGVTLPNTSASPDVTTQETPSNDSEQKDEKNDEKTEGENEIDRYFTMTKGELLEELGDEYEFLLDGPEASYDGYRYHTIGLTFAFEYEDLMHIGCSENFVVNGAHAGMTFSEIMKHLGSTEVKFSVWEFEGRNKNEVYRIEYEIGNCIFEFSSYDQDGSNSRLYIYRK